ncbi:MAG: glutamine cyclotransferase [Caulobacteraceae bacterium]|nr:glutamine cyclotransferase [Caulobacteraceae bacterium]
MSKPRFLPRVLVALTALVLTACIGGGPMVPQPASAAAPPDRVYDYQVVASFPHDTDAFTEGLFYQGGQLYESTGLEGKSFIRRVDLQTGKVLQNRPISDQYFGEGIIAWKDKLLELTWKNQVGFIYDLKTFEPIGQFSYPGEGWALTTDGRRIIMSDGTAQIRFLDPDTLKETSRINVTLQGKPMTNLNELEWVKGEIYANIWQTDTIVRIDPVTGNVVGRIDLRGLLSAADRAGSRPDVLNGIAYDAAGDRLFVTGKDWPKLYQIKLVERPQPVP